MSRLPRHIVATRADVVRAVEDDPGIRAGEVARRLGIATKAADAHLSRSVGAGDVCRYGSRGSYRYGPPGWVPTSSPGASLAQLVEELAAVRATIASSQVREAYLIAMLRERGVEVPHA